jgi:NADPH-dependent 2,4-dienoyl-CoA reductase/sulfur reductase-like enzyme/nitrite reductase/ring-hydroxylating ferredoxin subunit
MQEHEVARDEDLQEGELVSVELDGTPVLLWREGEAVHAVGATCPHAGAPLAEGVRSGHRLVCPWHKATFCLRTGALLEPPAVDPLPRFEARIDKGRVLLRKAELPPRPAPPADARCFVIIGAGAAGAVAAQTLREVGFGGRIVLLDRANRVPYDRTLLSKYVLSGQPGAEKSPLQSQDFYRCHGIERRTAEVVRIDVAQRRITCADGSVLAYDATLLATGAEPVRPDLPGVGLANVFTLRSRADAELLLVQAERSERAVVLGASFIGMEVAAALRERGIAVTVVANRGAPFEQQLGARIGGAFVGLHERRGVRFRLGRKVAALEGTEIVRAVRLADGEVLPADLVVVGFGVRPATGCLQGVALAEDGGVPVDAGLRAAEGVYVAGDAAHFPLYGSGERIRVEHWRVAEQHGRIAARNMAGGDARIEGPPVFWTIQYLKRLDYIGHAAVWDEVVVHGDLQKPEFLAYYVRNGMVRAAVGLDRDKDTAALVELFRQRQDWTAAALGNSPAALLG